MSDLTQLINARINAIRGNGDFSTAFAKDIELVRNLTNDIARDVNGDYLVMLTTNPEPLHTSSALSATGNTLTLVLGFSYPVTTNGYPCTAIGIVAQSADVLEAPDANLQFQAFQSNATHLVFSADADMSAATGNVAFTVDADSVLVGFPLIGLRWNVETAVANTIVEAANATVVLEP